MFAKLSAEFIGTFWLVLGGCGSAILSAAFPGVGIGLLGVSLAFGLTVLTGAYALGPISGGHFNPAVSVGLWAGGRFPAVQEYLRDFGSTYRFAPRVASRSVWLRHEQRRCLRHSKCNGRSAAAIHAGPGAVYLVASGALSQSPVYRNAEFPRRA